jgi:hypothetical protein
MTCCTTMLLRELKVEKKRPCTVSRWTTAPNSSVSPRSTASVVEVACRFSWCSTIQKKAALLACSMLWTVRSSTKTWGASRISPRGRRSSCTIEVGLVARAAGGITADRDTGGKRGECRGALVDPRVRVDALLVR